MCIRDRILEEWTHKKSVDDLARSMSLNVDKVWMVQDGTEILVSSDKVQTGDKIVVRVGNVVPFDGTVVSGDAMLNQASLTGESVPVDVYKRQRVNGMTGYMGGRFLQ